MSGRPTMGGENNHTTIFQVGQFTVEGVCQQEMEVCRVVGLSTDHGILTPILRYGSWHPHSHTQVWIMVFSLPSSSSGMDPSILRYRSHYLHSHSQVRITTSSLPSSGMDHGIHTPILRYGSWYPHFHPQVWMTGSTLPSSGIDHGILTPILRCESRDG